MNKLQETKIANSASASQAEQEILNDAENIILKFNKNRNNTKKIVILTVIPLLLIFLMFLFSIIFALINLNNTSIINGVSIQGVDVSGLEPAEAKVKVSSYLNSQLSKDITLTHGEYSVTVLPSQFNAAFDVDTAIDIAFNVGRTNNIFVNNYTILNTLTSGENVKVEMTYDTALLTSILEQLDSEIPDAVIQPSYYIDGNNLVISNGVNGVVIDKDSLITTLLTRLANITDEPINLEIPVINTQSNSIDIDAIYAEVYKQPSDAYFTTDPYLVHPSSTGFDFSISLDEAKNMVATYQEEYTIPLKVLYPKVSTSQIGTEAFPDLLASFSTSFASSNSNRSTNIQLATAKINGIVLMPGESFSYNKSVGKRTAANGFKEAPAYLNGEVVTEYGGGVCQVSSTLYNAVLLANLEVTERRNHTFKPSYVKPGLDATVSWGGPDFKFKNNRDYPIKIIATTSNKNVYFKILGLKSTSDYKVVMSANVVSTVYAKTVYTTDSSLATGATRVTQKASNGCKTQTYKTLYDQAGNFVSKTLISSDTYNAHNQTIAVGP